MKVADYPTKYRRRRRRPARPQKPITAVASLQPANPALPKPIDPETHRIRCQITGGPDRYTFFHEFPHAISQDGYHMFRSLFQIKYEQTSADYHACVKIIKYRSYSNFNIGGYINVRLPGEGRPQIRRFTGEYSVVSKAGHLRIYTQPVTSLKV